MIEEKLRGAYQEHILNFYNRLNDKDKAYLENQINYFDLNKLNKIYLNTWDQNNYIKNINELSPINVIESNNNFTELGETIIKNNQYGIVLLAGGNASRLGLNIPKGCLELNIKNKKVSIFELYINQLKDIYKKYNQYINLYIMTNDETHEEIINFFKVNNYFDYPQNRLHFFYQDKLPITGVDGSLLMKDEKTLLVGPNGNGDVYQALKRNNMLNDIKRKGIKYLLFLTIDNVLNKLVDLNMLGNMIDGNYKVASKSIIKDNDNDIAWVFCKYKGKPSMWPTEYITKELTNTMIDNKYVYRDKNITYHIIEIDEVYKYASINLPYDRAYKQYDYLDLDGKLMAANEKNSFKYERFIFDAFSYSDDMLVYRVDKAKEFCPIKDFDDIKKVEDILN